VVRLWREMAGKQSSSILSFDKAQDMLWNGRKITVLGFAPA